MNPADRRLWLDLQATNYLTAIENADFDRQEQLWALAAQDAELEEAFHEIHLGLAEESTASVAATIADTVAKHMPSAEVMSPSPGRVTVGMVAEELFRHTPDQLPADAHALNDRLRQVVEELPDDLGLPELSDWLTAKFGPAPTEYLKAFRHAATKVRMRASPDAEYQLAARRTKPPGGAP